MHILITLQWPPLQTNRPRFISVTMSGVYSPLPHAKSLRLLELLPGQFDDDIRCRLLVSNVDEVQDYTAISYVWGDPKITLDVICNGGPVQVTTNASAILRKLRSDSAHVLCWIDVLCINQLDLDERSQQVRLMRDIYRSAPRIVVYLGEEDESLRRALPIFDHLSAIANKYELSSGLNREISTHEIGTLPPMNATIWDDFQDVYRKDWFSRIWVLQEVAVASCDPTVVCGSIQVPWSVIGEVAMVYHCLRLPIYRIDHDHSYNASLMRTLSLPPGRANLTLPLLLRRVRTFQATDSRDKLYALAGVLPNISDGNERSLWEIDYRKSVIDVYRNAALSIIQFSGGLGILSDVGPLEQGSGIAGLPSWVPDWSGYLQSPCLSNNRYNDKYNASNGTALAISSHPISHILRITGCMHDTISWTAGPFELLHFDVVPKLRKPGKLVKIWNEVHRRLGLTYCGDRTVDVFWRTLVANTDRSMQPVTQMEYIHFLAYWHFSRLSDMKAEEFIEEHTVQPDPQSPAERKKARENRPSTSIEFYSALRRKAEKLLAQSNIPCTNSSGLDRSACAHCRTLDNPEMITTSYLPPIEGPDPLFSAKDNDPFLSDYFERLNTDIEDPISILLGDVKHFADNFTQKCRYRNFFITDRGLMGIGPATTKIGDRVAILSGGRLPFILREIGEQSVSKTGTSLSNTSEALKYHFLGESYIHGLMDGEAAKEADLNTTWKWVDLV